MKCYIEIIIIEKEIFIVGLSFLFFQHLQGFFVFFGLKWLMQKGLDFHVFYIFYGNGSLRTDRRYYDIFIKINSFSTCNHWIWLSLLVVLNWTAIKCNYVLCFYGTWQSHSCNLKMEMYILWNNSHLIEFCKFYFVAYFFLITSEENDNKYNLKI